MKIKKLYLKNFRNHEHLVLNFNNNLTLIYGDNGLGKTNILEAIYFLATTKSLKAEVDKELINHNSNFLITQALCENNEEELNLEVTLDCIHSVNNRSIKKVKINQVPKSITYFAGKLKSVLFTPADLDTLFSSSTIRRKYLDSIFYQISEEYKKSIIDYTKALKQRNKILEIYKETGRGLEQLDIWTEVLIREGTVIQKYRDDFFNFFEDNLNSLYEKLKLENIQIEINYKKNEASIENFQNQRNKEIYSGNTACGPHKDDFNIIFNQRDVSKYGSRGQQRVSISVLKFTELDYIHKTTSERPVLLLDDIFSELDDLNKKAILNLIPNQQTIITSVYPMEELKELNSNILNIKELISQ
jgi:DNA replication and repair protein RecF